MKWNLFVGSLVLGLGLSTQSFGADLLDRMLGANYDGCCGTANCCETKCADPCCGVVDPCCDAQCKPKCRKTPLLDLLCGPKCCKKQNCCADPCCEPTCGCEDPCCEPKCGCEPTCVDPCCQKQCKTKKCRRSLLDILCNRCQKQNCCEPTCGCEDPCCEPKCGCEVACDPCCASKCKKRCRVSLLDRIFGCSKCCKISRCNSSCCKTSCCEPQCGCEPSCCVVVDPCCEPQCGCEPACGCEGHGAPAEAPTEAEKDVETAIGPAPVVDPSAFLPTKRRFAQTSMVR